MRSWAWVAAVVACGVAGCTWKEGKPDGSGTIECTQVDVSSLVPGRIAETLCGEGDSVKADDVLARIDPADMNLRAAEARAALDAAQAQHDLVKAGSRVEDIERASHQFEETEAAERAAQADLARTGKVFEQGNATQKQMDDAKALADRARAVREAAGQNLERFRKGSRAEEVRLAQAQVDLARVRLEAAEKAVRDCIIKAPLAGTVSTRSREAGEFVAVGAPLLTLSRLDEVWLAIYVPERRVAGVKLGQPARVSVDVDSRMHEGRVTFISSMAEFTPRNVQTPDEREKLVYRLKITLKNPDGLFKPGMPADGYLTPQAEPGKP
jgi:HlyD family secretion protein